MLVKDILIGSIAGNEALTSAPLAGAVLVGLLVSWVVLKSVPKADAVLVILYYRTWPPCLNPLAVQVDFFLSPPFCECGSLRPPS